MAIQAREGNTDDRDGPVISTQRHEVEAHDEDGDAMMARENSGCECDDDGPTEGIKETNELKVVGGRGGWKGRKDAGTRRAIPMMMIFIMVTIGNDAIEMVMMMITTCGMVKMMCHDH